MKVYCFLLPYLPHTNRSVQINLTKMKKNIFSILLISTVILVTSCKKEENETNNDQTIRVILTEQNSNAFGLTKGDTIDWSLEVNFSDDDWEYESKLVLDNVIDTTFTFPNSPQIVDFNFQAGKDNTSNQDWHMESTYKTGKSHTIYVFDTILVQ